VAKIPWQVILQAAPVPIHKREPALGKALASVIDKALREEPEIGYQSAGDLRHALLGI
jgi:serine/threonine-protein kinase